VSCMFEFIVDFVSLVISSLTHCLFRSMFFNFHIFVGFPSATDFSFIPL
jgi:hypothetical protein